MNTIIDLIKIILSEAWIALVTAVLTSTLTLIGVWLTNSANNRRLKIQLDHERKIKEEELNRERIEELYIISNKYLNTLVTNLLFTIS